jgi:hypothetical protein
MSSGVTADRIARRSIVVVETLRFLFLFEDVLIQLNLLVERGQFVAL